MEPLVFAEKFATILRQKEATDLYMHKEQTDAAVAKFYFTSDYKYFFYNVVNYK